MTENDSVAQGLHYPTLTTKTKTIKNHVLQQMYISDHKINVWCNGCFVKFLQLQIKAKMDWFL